MIGQSSSKRRIVPRWRQTVVVVRTGEADPIGERIKPWASERSEIEEDLFAWKNIRSPLQAVELATSALLYGEPHLAQEAAGFLLKTSVAHQLPNLLANRVQEHLGLPTSTLDQNTHSFSADEPLRAAIRQHRASLRNNPRNPLGWCDMSLAYASLGEEEKALRSMTIALSLGIPNRMLLRSASRLFVHRGEPDRAHRLLLRSSLTRHDPWLMAAELATASIADQKPLLIRQSRALIKDQFVQPFHKTELASALATLELEAGKDRLARKLFRLSLTAPTDNSVAQAEWASQHYAPLSVLRSHLDIQLGYEARARRALSDRQWGASIEESWKWLEDQPFSSLPAVFGSYVASVGALDFEEAARFAEKGLIANPTDVLLRNNLVFSLANVGKLEEAQSEYRKINRPHELELLMVWLATGGLLRYRGGHSDHGKSLYREAISVARSLDNPKALCLATTFFAREELLSASPTAQETVREALSVGKSNPMPELVKWHRILRDLDRQALRQLSP